jgi:hypothetical protein
MNGVSEYNTKKRLIKKQKTEENNEIGEWIISGLKKFQQVDYFKSYHDIARQIQNLYNDGLLVTVPPP